MPDSGVDVSTALASRAQLDVVRLLACGSVDDGKSTLIGRLLYDTGAIHDDHLEALRRDSERSGHAPGDVDLSFLTDGLRAEREQGITIDVAYRYFSTSRRTFLIVDSPGHEQYTRNMATAASTCDLAVILVDASQGVLSQTRRHTFIATLLGVRHLVVAVNKMDLVSYSEAAFDRVRAQLADFAAKLEVGDLRFIPVSALHGDNVAVPSTRTPWYSGGPLLHTLETIHVASDRNLIDLRLPVQLICRPDGTFRGIAGTLASGVVRAGEAVAVLPSLRQTRVARILTPSGDAQMAFAPMAVTVVLEDAVDVARGDMLAHPDNLPWLDHDLEAMLVWMDEQPLEVGRAYLFKHATSLVSGTVSALRYRIDVTTLHRQATPNLTMNDVGRCSITLTRDIPYDAYSRNRTTGGFIVIDRGTNRTVGAGVIVERGVRRRGAIGHWNAPAVVPPVRAASSGSATAPGALKAGQLGQRPATIFLTGPPGAGKKTLARALEWRLAQEGKVSVLLEGGDLLRTVNCDLGSSTRDATEHLRRVSAFARLLNDAGLICVCALSAGNAELRERAREAVGGDRFLEVHVTAAAEVRRRRHDDQGARETYGEVVPQGEADEPYEAPAAPALMLETDRLTIDEAVDRLLEVLRARGIVRSLRL